MSKPRHGVRYAVLFRIDELNTIRRDLERLNRMGNFQAGLSRGVVLNRIYAELAAIKRKERSSFENAPQFYKPTNTEGQ